jgi:hypothetical protein
LYRFDAVGIDGRIILKWIVEKWDGNAGAGGETDQGMTW